MMLCCQLQVLLVAVSMSVLLAQASGAQQSDRLAELLRTDLPEEKEEFSRVLLLKMFSDLLKPENAILPAEDSGIRRDVTRQLHVPQRERKAGCKNFFWKTFTSC
ncbi:somatostatin-1-like [Acipenser oxyrinchus oxyrinchus]|uniref:Somatostatin-1-like n=1 Tax=Acipenser oxyrinchus oxyrinchus TaxID=40147 RepID=A0AAD8CMC3_ACIOX|nr:somatostatin-1-like [Acipenser oxyrinchus oxyrinchus]